MGISFDYEMYIRPDDIGSALRFLAARAPQEDRPETTVILRSGERLLLPFADSHGRQSLINCAARDSLYLWLVLEVDVDQEIARRFTLFDWPQFTEIDGKTYRYKDDLSDRDLDDLDLDDRQLRDRGILVSTGTTSVGVHFEIDFSSRPDPHLARLRCWSWSTRTHFLFGSSPEFYRVFADLAAATHAVCWFQGCEIGDDITVYWLNGEAIDPIRVPVEKFATVGELTTSLSESRRNNHAPPLCP